MTFSYRSFLLWSLVAAPAAGLLLHDRFGLVWETRALSAVEIGQDTGYPGGLAYVIPVGTTWMNHDKRGTSAPAQVLEDGVRLPLMDSPHADVASKGAGRYSLWGGHLHFSTSDNSDPRTNGRKYQLYWPVPVVLSPVLAWALYLLPVLATVPMAWRGLTWLARTIRSTNAQGAEGWQRLMPGARSLFMLSCWVVVLSFALARLPWLLDFPIPVIAYDTRSYFDPIRQMNAGVWPTFQLRTPGYSTFLALALGTVSKLMFVVALQHGLSLCSTLFFLYAVFKTCGRVVVLAALAMTAHVTQRFLTSLDSAILTESLFTSLFLFFLGFLILGSRSLRLRSLLAASILGACAIMVRPAGIFVLGCVIIACVHLFHTRISRWHIVLFAIPIPAFLLVLMAYNRLTLGAAEVSGVSGLTRWSITATFWETDPSFPPEVNKSISQIAAEVPSEDRQVSLQSWDVDEIQTVNAKWSSHVAWSCPNIDGKFYRSHPKYFDQVAWKAITAHPGAAIRIFTSTLRAFLYDPNSHRVSMYTNMQWVATQMYVEGIAKEPFVGREFSSFPSLRTVELERSPDGKPSIHLNEGRFRGRELYEVVGNLSQTAFDGVMYKRVRYWTVAYGVVLLASVLRVVQTRFRHWGVFVVFVVSSSLVGAALVVAATTTISDRYPAPTRFIEVLSVALVSLLWSKEEDTVSEEPSEAPSTGNRGEFGMMQNTAAIGDVVRNYCRWNLSVFPIEKHRRILDVGCGPCLYLDAVLEYKPVLYLATDYSQDFLDMARKRVASLGNCRVAPLDIVNLSHAGPVLALDKLDYVFCFDVVEHLDDDISALRNIRKIMLATDASSLFVRVPALPVIFGTNDEAIGHYRRYTRKSLRRALEAAGFDVDRPRYQNLAGILPWFIIGRLRRRSLAVAPHEGRVFDMMVPVLRRIERLLPPPVGLSVHCVARVRPGAPEREQATGAPAGPSTDARVAAES